MSGAVLWWLFFIVIFLFLSTSYLVYSIYFAQFGVAGDRGIENKDTVESKYGKYFGSTQKRNPGLVYGNEDVGDESENRMQVSADEEQKEYN